MRPYLREDGLIAVPMRAEAEDGTVGDGVRLVHPGTPEYEALAAGKEPSDEQP